MSKRSTPPSDETELMQTRVSPATRARVDKKLLQDAIRRGGASMKLSYAQYLRLLIERDVRDMKDRKE